jgi:uncharacterized protein (DUF169 family)
MTDAIGIAVLDHLPLGVAHAETPSRHCTFVGLARQGRTLWASGDDVTCPLARLVLGLDPADAATVDAVAARLVEWGSAKDFEVARRFLASAATLPFGERVFVYAPLEASPFPPDVIVRFVRPDEAAMRLRALAAATAAGAEGRSAGTGAMCGECTAFPLLTGRAALSPGCPGSRREVFAAPEELFLALPYALDRAAVGA